MIKLQFSQKLLALSLVGLLVVGGVGYALTHTNSPAAVTVTPVTSQTATIPSTNATPAPVAAPKPVVTPAVTPAATTSPKPVAVNDTPSAPASVPAATITPETPSPVACTNSYPEQSCTYADPEPTSPQTGGSGLTQEDPSPVACTNSWPVQSCTY